MKIIKPNLPKISFLIAFLVIFSYLDRLAKNYGNNHFDYIPLMFSIGVVILALNFFVLQVHIENWFTKKGKLELNLTYLIISILFVVIFFKSPFNGFISLDYIMLMLFMICYCLIKSFERKE